jgi:HAD superfamily hydrolase (TIGR01509 family)
VQDGIKEIIRLVQANHLKLGLCTTSTRHQVDVVFARVKSIPFDPNLLFDAVTTGDSVTRRKPHAEPYLLTAQKLGETPKDCLVIEDSLSGIQSAKAAGCSCVGLRQAYNKHIDFSAADMVIEQLKDVLLLK